MKAKFDGHFVKRRNVIYERARFNQRVQEPGESVDAFITALYGLAEHCGYAGLHDEMIRDRILVGLRDAKLSENLQLDSDLTLEKAVTKVRQAETVKQQQPLVRGSGGSQVSNRQHETHLGVVTYKRRWSPPRSRQKSDKPLDKGRQGAKPSHCGWCGKSPPHRKQQCPAKDIVCHKCHKRGHFQSVCRSVNQLHTESGDSDSSSVQGDAYLGVITRGDRNNPWYITVSINDKPVDFEIDTEAEVIVISSEAHHEIGGPTLGAASKTLRGPSNSELPVKGQFTAMLKYKDLYVVESLHKHLLGRPAIEALNVVTRVLTIEGSGNPVEQYPQLFVGLGKLEGYDWRKEHSHMLCRYLAE